MNEQEILSKMKPEHAKVIKDALDASAASLKEAQDSLANVTKERDEAQADLETTKKALEDANKRLEDLAKEKHPDDCTCPECMAKKSSSNPDAVSFDQTETFKSMPEEAKKFLATLKAQKEAAEEELRKSRDAAIEAEAVAKAAKLKAIPVEQDKLVGIIKSASPELLEVLEVVNTAIEGTVLGEVGKAAKPAESGASDAWSKIEAKADELTKSSNITKAKAISEVIKNNPDLYREYLEGGAN